MGIQRRRRGNAGTASWSDRGIGQPVRQYAYEKLTYTGYGQAEEGKGNRGGKKSGTTVRIGPKRRNRSQEWKSVTSISVGLLQGRAKAAVKRDRKKGNTKTLQAFPPVSKRGRRRSWKENARNARPKGEGKGISLAVCRTVQ